MFEKHWQKDCAYLENVWMRQAFWLMAVLFDVQMLFIFLYMFGKCKACKQKWISCLSWTTYYLRRLSDRGFPL